MRARHCLSKRPLANAKFLAKKYPRVTRNTFMLLKPLAKDPHGLMWPNVPVIQYLRFACVGEV